MFNINQFRTHIGKTGVLQNNKFMVRFTHPTVMQDIILNTGIGDINTSTLGKLFEYRAEAAKIPGVNLQVSDNNRYGIGPSQQMPGNVQFTDINITFINDSSGILYNYFYAWISSIFDFSGVSVTNSIGKNVLPTYTVEYKKNYATDLQIYVFDNMGLLVSVVDMIDAFPVALNDIALAWDDNNSLMKVNIRFAFTNFVVLDVKSSANTSLINTPLSNTIFGATSLIGVSDSTKSPSTQLQGSTNGQ